MASPRPTPQVEIFSKDNCPYCIKAKMLFDQLGVTYEETNLTHTPSAYDDLLSRKPDARTVPQIFINSRPIGGCDDLYALHASGQLLPLLGR
jgi:GrxC family glutaredoxin